MHDPQPTTYDGGDDRPSVAVLAPTPLLTVTIESGVAGDEVHLHAGGQGLWVARMVAALGARPHLIGVFGGETGSVVHHLVVSEGVDVRRVAMAGSNGAYVHDRRRGERVELAVAPASGMTRHEVDEWYGQALVECLDADVAVVAGAANDDVLPVDLYRRLVGDLRRNGRAVVADLSGESLRAALEGGVDALKISHEELIEAGFAEGDSDDEVFAGIDRVRAAGAHDVVVSRGDAPTLASFGDRRFAVTPPSFEPADTRGGGDSMAAALAVGRARGLDAPDVLRLAGAAGALAITRRGLATASGHQVRRMTGHVEVTAR